MKMRSNIIATNKTNETDVRVETGNRKAANYSTFHIFIKCFTLTNIITHQPTDLQVNLHQLE